MLDPGFIKRFKNEALLRNSHMKIGSKVPSFLVANQTNPLDK